MIRKERGKAAVDSQLTQTAEAEKPGVHANHKEKQKHHNAKRRKSKEIKLEASRKEKASSSMILL